MMDSKAMKVFFITTASTIGFAIILSAGLNSLSYDMNLSSGWIIGFIAGIIIAVLSKMFTDGTADKYGRPLFIVTVILISAGIAERGFIWLIPVLAGAVYLVLLNWIGAVGARLLGIDDTD